jgi:phosphonate transport system substrate-binding protein
MRAVTTIVVGLAALLALAACGDAASDGQGSGDGQGGQEPTLLIGGIPDQDRSFLEERFGAVADRLSQKLGIPVEYQPSTDYAAVVTAFRNGDIQLGWFGGFTGVQARSTVDGARAIAQRQIDTQFHSVFIAQSDVAANSLADLGGSSFTFGSESSTSGHLMPRHYLREAGIDADEDFETVSYSGSHDTTAQQVAAGSFEAGALNATVWDTLVEDGEIDTERVQVVERVGPYSDYNWTAHPRIDEVYGEGTTEEITQALLAMDDTPQGRDVLDMFSAEEFIASSNDNYAQIEQVARDLGMLQ